MLNTKLADETIGHLNNQLIKFNKIKVPIPKNCNHYKTLGTSELNSPMSPPFLESIEQELLCP